MQTAEITHSNPRLSQVKVPQTYFQELAEMGALYDFLRNFMSDDFRTNIDFRREMLGVMIDNIMEYKPELEFELLHELRDSLTSFIDGVQQCNTVHH